VQTVNNIPEECVNFNTCRPPQADENFAKFNVSTKTSIHD